MVWLMLWRLCSIQRNVKRDLECRDHRTFRHDRQKLLKNLVSRSLNVFNFISVVFEQSVVTSPIKLHMNQVSVVTLELAIVPIKI
jgi:hypothetical protein